MKYCLTIAFLLSTAFYGRGGDGDWAVSNIAPAMLINANVVKRFDHTEYEVINYSKARLREKYVITILNENGDRFSSLLIYYDKLRSIKSIDGKLYDKYGRTIKELRNRDIQDYSATSSSTLMDDSRVKLHDFHCKDYPYTVEYEIVTEFNNTFLFPSWFPQPAESYSVEKAEISVKCPSWYGFNYKVFKVLHNEPVISGKDDKIYTWQVADQPAIIGAYAISGWQFIAPCIYFSPKIFEIGNYKGSMDSWKQFGDFILDLNKDRDKLPDEIKRRVHDLTDGIFDKKEKVRVLYEYMQKNTRYISIQLGIGGYQPFDATSVAEKSYGDCKALSNYMYALLKEANIPSCYTLIYANWSPPFFIPDFTYNRFNHVIICVPLQKDTVWLECTSQTLPAGYLGGFTADRYGLAIDQNGGHLVRTPKYGVNENEQIRQVTAVLDEEANLQLTSVTSYSGLQQDRYHEMINSLSKEKVKEILHEELDLSTYEVNDFAYKEYKKELPVMQEQLNISVSNYAAITGKRLFIIPNVLSRNHRKLSADPDRHYPVSLYGEYRDIDTVMITIPPGYIPESLPENVSISNQFGRFSSSVKLNGNKLMYYRKMEQYSGEFPATDYSLLVKFFDDVYRADRNKVVLVKK